MTLRFDQPSPRPRIVLKPAYEGLPVTVHPGDRRLVMLKPPQSPMPWMAYGGACIDGRWYFARTSGDLVRAPDHAIRGWRWYETRAAAL